MNELEQSMTKVVPATEADTNTPRVEVLGDELCTRAELDRAILASAITSGVVCAIAGVGLGYLLGVRTGRG